MDPHSQWVVIERNTEHGLPYSLILRAGRVWRLAQRVTWGFRVALRADGAYPEG